MPNRTELLLFIVSFLILCLLHYFFFELRYAWHNKLEDSIFLQQGHAVFLITICLMAAFYPSKILVVIIVPTSLLFPPILRSEVFAPLDSAMLILTGVMTVVFLLLMIWRQRIGRLWPGG